MFRKALKIIAPSIVGNIAALIICAFIFGVQVAINMIIPLSLGICGGFIAALYFAAKEEDKEDNE